MADDDPSGTAPTPFDRLGGREAVTRLVGEFYRRILADPVLSPFFVGVPTDKLAHMQSEFFSMALGGPDAYTGRPLREVHAGMGIRAKHLQRFMDHLTATLQDYDLSRDEKYEIASRLDGYADEITGGTAESG